jgi:DNA-binding transcriptional regulator LsrR (DeoR family)
MCTKYGIENAYGFTLSNPITESEKQSLLQVNIAIVGIGNLDKDSTLGKNLSYHRYNIRELENIVVGDICSTAIDVNGDAVYLNRKDHTVGLSPSEIRGLYQRGGRVIGISGGSKKAPAIQAVLKGGKEKMPYIDTLITDEMTAKKLLGLK